MKASFSLLRKPAWIVFVLISTGVPAYTQSRLKLIDNSELSASDAAVLESAKQLEDLPCEVSPIKPAIGIDLRFRTGYTVSIPLNSLAGKGSELRVLLRVSDNGQPSRTALFSSRISTPPVEPDTKGDAELSGDFAVGPGRYKVDWLMSDGAQTCSDHWELEAKLSGPFKSVQLAIPAGTAAELPEDPFYDSGPPAKNSKVPLYLKILVSFSPAGANQSVFTSEDQQAMTSILRAILREPRFGRFSLTLFSIDQERVLCRQPPGPGIDFPALGRCVQSLRSGTINLRQIAEPGRATGFLTGLLSQEFAPSQEPRPDAIVVLSPKISLDGKIATDVLERQSHVHCPVFYLNYNPDPGKDPWRGAISAALKAYHALEYTITGPRDLGNALMKMKEHVNSAQ